MNAVIRGITKSAIHDYGLEVFGVEDGYSGLIEKRGHFLSSDDVSGILTHGGTILGTSNTADPFHVAVSKGRRIVFEDRSKRAVRNIREWQLDALLVVGGDGTLTIADRLFRRGVPIIGIPKTIDNDLSGTDFTFGFDTAVSIATDACDRLHTTAEAHHRVMILEVMGRNAGWIALFAGTAGGADIILIPERPFYFDVICSEVEQRVHKGKRFSLIVVAEGAHETGSKPLIKRKDRRNPRPAKLGGIAESLAMQIESVTGIESRAAVLGHIQRGGSPTAFDRNLGTQFGVHAMELAIKGRWGQMVCLDGHFIDAIPIHQAVHPIKKVPLNHQLLRSSRAVGTSFGRR